MSYPRTIQPLVIEDEIVSKELFEAVFLSLGAKYPITTPHFAFCHADGRRLLKDDRIYHLVTIDLRLPELPGQPPAESIDFGQALVRDCANRNSYPIPAALVITAHLDQASQHELSELMSKSFAYGRVLVKSDDLQVEIDNALLFVERYCGVGIHLRDSGATLFPTLTPREEDLLRQIVLADESRIGIDLEWWAAGYTPSTGWTKTLIGRFLLSEGRGHSLYSFFKLMTNEQAPRLFGDAEVMSQKLRHVKVLASRIAGDRSILVTQSVGSGITAPRSLDQLLSLPQSEFTPHAKRLAEEIVAQVAAIGDRTPEQRDRRHLLWHHHDRQRIESQWLQRGGESVLTDFATHATHPVELYDTLSQDGSVVRYDVQSALHGDLNFSNVAIDDDAGIPRAFIFDASGCDAGVCVRDVAMLEVATILHQDMDYSILAAICLELYGDGVEAHQVAAATDRQSNTLAFIRNLRDAALKFTTLDVYALMVVDHALIQLGGLAFGSAFNKITSPRNACVLAAMAAHWYRSLLSTRSSMNQAPQE